MIKLKTLRLRNFAGHKDVTFDFASVLGDVFGQKVKPLALFYGPNGIGKTSVLEAIRFVTNPQVLLGRTGSLETYLRPFVLDEEFLPDVDSMKTTSKNMMRVEAVFATDNGDKKVTLTNYGFETNEIPNTHGGCSYYLDADHPINWSKFQLVSEHAGRFIQLAEAIYGYPVDLAREVETDGLIFYQDVIIRKGDTKVHFVKMSAGEKKIATMIRQLCNPDNVDGRDIIMIDNVEMHVYSKRHRKLIDSLIEFFPTKQLIVTTHSGVMIEHVAVSCRYNMEEYKPEYNMIESQHIGREEIENKMETIVTGQLSDADRKVANNSRRFEMNDGVVIYAPSEFADRTSYRAGKYIPKLNCIYEDAIRVNEPEVADKQYSKSISHASKKPTLPQPWNGLGLPPRWWNHPNTKLGFFARIRVCIRVLATGRLYRVR